MTAIGLTKSPTQWQPSSLSVDVKQPEREADPKLVPILSFTSILAFCLHAVIQRNLTNSDNCVLFAHYDLDVEARCNKRTVQKISSFLNEQQNRHGLNNPKYVGYLKYF
jgi:hypothetical protein